MTVNRAQNQVISEEERGQFDVETRGGGGGFSFKPGSTAFMLVYQEGESPLSAFSSTTSVYKGKESTRFVAYALLYGTQDTEEPLPDHFKEQLTPIYMPKLLARELGRSTLGVKSFAGEDKAGALYTEQKSNGTLFYGDLFVVTRVGSGLETKYTVSIERGLPDDYLATFPESVPVPDKTIQKIAAENTENQLARAQTERASPQQHQINSPQEGTLNDLAGFQ